MRASIILTLKSLHDDEDEEQNFQSLNEKLMRLTVKTQFGVAFTTVYLSRFARQGGEVHMEHAIGWGPQVCIYLARKTLTSPPTRQHKMFLRVTSVKLSMSFLIVLLIRLMVVNALQLDV